MFLWVTLQHYLNENCWTIFQKKKFKSQWMKKWKDKIRCINIKYVKCIDKSNIKGTVSVISSDSPCKDGNPRFTTAPLKALSDKIWIRFRYQTDILQLWILSNSTFLLQNTLINVTYKVWRVPLWIGQLKLLVQSLLSQFL